MQMAVPSRPRPRPRARLRLSLSPRESDDIAASAAYSETGVLRAVNAQARRRRRRRRIARTGIGGGGHVQRVGYPFADSTLFRSKTESPAF